ncbi:tetraacyldisaccharide 4'-kinase [Amorphus suaedae]
MTRSAPRFWWEGGAAGVLLAPLGALVGFVAGRRLRLPAGGRLAIPVICIGNPTVGGSGKTPTAIAVADMLRAAGHAPAFLLRGYGGRLAGPVLVDLDAHMAEDVGDEALLLARHAPTVVSRDRLAGGRLLERSGAGVVVMDDGFQNPGLHKDVSVLVIDAAVGVGNGRVTPAGPLRAALAPQLARADAVILVGSGTRGDAVAGQARQGGLPVLRARLAPVAEEGFAGLRVLLFAGIGRPEKVAATLAEAGAEVVRLEAFPDHHPFTEADAERLLGRAARERLALVTTEKDLARLAGSEGARGRLAEAARPIAVDLRFEDPDAVRAVLAKAVSD